MYKRPSSRMSQMSSVASLERITPTNQQWWEDSQYPAFVTDALPDDSISLIRELEEELGLNYDRYYDEDEKYVLVAESDETPLEDSDV